MEHLAVQRVLAWRIEVVDREARDDKIEMLVFVVREGFERS